MKKMRKCILLTAILTGISSHKAAHALNRISHTLGHLRGKPVLSAKDYLKNQTMDNPNFIKESDLAGLKKALNNSKNIFEDITSPGQWGHSLIQGLTSGGNGHWALIIDLLKSGNLSDHKRNLLIEDYLLIPILEQNKVEFLKYLVTKYTVSLPDQFCRFVLDHQNRREMGQYIREYLTAQAAKAAGTPQYRSENIRQQSHTTQPTVTHGWWKNIKATLNSWWSALNNARHTLFN